MYFYAVRNVVDNTVTEGYLTEGEAKRNCSEHDEVVPVWVEGIGNWIKRYYQFRGLTMPANEMQALAFLVSELGEFADALVSSAGSWVRNTPDKDRDPALEAGDVLMMLYVTALHRGIDPFTALKEKNAIQGVYG